MISETENPNSKNDDFVFDSLREKYEFNRTKENSDPNETGQQEPQKETVATLPSKEEMTRLLKEAGIYGTTPQTDRMYDSFIEKVAGSEKVGMGLVMAWELAKYDTLQGYPPMIAVLVDMNFDQVVDAVSPNPELANEAKMFKNKVQEAAKK
jgi:hypothetical protein